MSRLIVLLGIAALILLTACEGNARFSDAEEDTAATIDADRDDRYAIYSRGGEVKLGLTDEAIYYRLSDSLLQEVDREMARETEGRDGIGGAIADAVTGGVSDLLRHQMEYRVEDIRDLRYQDGQIAITFEDGTTETPDVESEDGEPVFPQDDAERFIDAFRKVKQAR